MKLRYALLIAFALVFSAQFANATPVDPSVIINRTSLDATTFSTNSVSNPLIITLNSQGFAPLQTFQYTGTTPLTQLFVELDGALPLEQFDCVSNIFTGCGTFNTGVGDEVGLIFKDGTLFPDDLFSAEVTAPEPATLLLLLTGGAMLLGFARKR